MKTRSEGPAEFTVEARIQLATRRVRERKGPQPVSIDAEGVPREGFGSGYVEGFVSGNLNFFEEMAQVARQILEAVKLLTQKITRWRSSGRLRRSSSATSWEHTDIPIPLTVRPLPPIDPHASPLACVELVSILYHAEKAALDAFDRLADPAVVENCDLFLQARAMLMADENAHLRDMEAIIRVVGGDGIRPVRPGFDELWDLERARRKLLFPLRARVAALFTLVAESLGYAYLYHLVNATTDPKVTALLRTNMQDEERHLRVSMEVLRAALAHGSALAAFDLALHFYAFLLLSRRAARTMLTTLAAIGLDPYVITGSSLQFTCVLLIMVAEETFGRSALLRRLEALLRLVFSPTMMRFFKAASYLPEPPLIWPALRGLARIIQRLSA